MANWQPKAIADKLNEEGGSQSNRKDTSSCMHHVTAAYDSTLYEESEHVIRLKVVLDVKITTSWPYSERKSLRHKFLSIKIS